MDSMITAAACALGAGDALGALNYVALRKDAPALTLRGIAMAQLGDLVRARTLLRSAARTFGARNPAARARCVVAELEIALAARDLQWPDARLGAAQKILEQHNDRRNATHARLLRSRRLLLIGQLDAAARTIAGLDAAALAPAARAMYEMVIAGIAIRRIHAKAARAALHLAQDAALAAHIPSLQAEVENALLVLDAPAARLHEQGREQLLTLEEVEELFASNTFVVDACRHAVRAAGTVIPLTTRPILFTLVCLLAHAWPADVTRSDLIISAFRIRTVDETHRARLRVEIGRLRKLLANSAGIEATQRGFVLVPRHARTVAVLAHPVAEKHAAVLACLADGECWSSSALALALDTSQRSVQRALDALAAGGKVQSFGLGRARRWTLPAVPAFTTTLLLSAPALAD